MLLSTRTLKGAVLFAVLFPLVCSGQPWLSDEERLLRGNVIITFREVPSTFIHEVEGRILLEAPVGLVWDTLRDYDSWAKIFPDLEQVKVIEKSGNTVRLEIRINNIWPVSDFEYAIAVSEKLPEHSLSWAMEEGNLKTLYGSCGLRIFKNDPEKTMVSCTMARDPGWFVPFFSSDLANRSVVIERMVGLRKEVRSRKRYMEQKSGEDNNIRPKWKKALFWWEKDKEAAGGGEENKKTKEDNAPPGNEPQ